jgi:hypothetical protein
MLSSFRIPWPWVAAALCAVLMVLTMLDGANTRAKLRAAEGDLALCRQATAFQNQAVEQAASAAKARAEQAEAALAKARKDGAAERREAQRLLSLTLPAGADSCLAAQALVDQQIAKERQ